MSRWRTVNAAWQQTVFTLWKVKYSVSAADASNPKISGFFSPPIVAMHLQAALQPTSWQPDLIMFVSVIIDWLPNSVKYCIIVSGMGQLQMRWWCILLYFVLQRCLLMSCWSRSRSRRGSTRPARSPWSTSTPLTSGRTATRPRSVNTRNASTRRSSVRLSGVKLSRQQQPRDNLNPVQIQRR